ncbi:hypothetical protein F5Y03DRAFT_346119 [Xylaria venustula]|nr:hypothetical protein F5Y03DRAFT_346119 [Xylaria venustula]
MLARAYSTWRAWIHLLICTYLVQVSTCPSCLSSSKRLYTTANTPGEPRSQDRPPRQNRILNRYAYLFYDLRNRRLPPSLSSCFQIQTKERILVPT